jgi:excisionase family DNA binding protein
MKQAKILITVEEAAVRLGKSTWMVYEYVKQGVLPIGVVVRLGRSIQFSSGALDAFIAQGGRGLPDHKRYAGAAKGQ